MDNNSNNSKTGLFVVLGILGVIGIVMLLTRQGGSENKSPSYQRSYTEPATDEWEIVRPVHPSNTPSTIPPTTLYENKEEWELVRGPDRLIEKIVITRKVTQNG